MNFINTWIQGIVVAVIISTIIEMILPNGNNKKYIKVVIGIYILFTIISPIIKKFSRGDFNIDNVLNNTVKEYTSDNYEGRFNDSYIRDLYIENVKKDIANRLKEKGFVVEAIDLIVSGEADYVLEGVNIMLHKKTTKTNKIQQVDINISQNTDEEYNDNLNEKDKKNLKEYICSLYDIDKDSISINV